MRKYWFLFTTQLVNSLAYPAELVGRSLLMLPFMWIFAQLWRVTFSAAGSAEISGLTLPATLWYLMMTETIELSRPRLAAAISEAVKDGSIAYILSKPYDFLLYHLSTSLGETVFRALINALFGSTIIWLLAGPPPAPLGYLAVIPTLVGTWVLNFCLAAMIGLLAFVVEDTSGFQWIFQKLSFIFGGLLIPLDFYPEWLQEIAKALPFAAMLYAPARLFVEPSPRAFLATLQVQALWILGLGLGLALFYRRSVKFLTVNGG